MSDFNPQAPNKPDEWIRLGRRGDQLTIWRHGFYPTLECHILFEGRYDDPQVAKILTGLESLTPPLRPATEHEQSLAALKMLRERCSPDSDVNVILDQLTHYVRRRENEDADDPTIPDTPPPAAPPRTRLSGEAYALQQLLLRKLNASDQETLYEGTRVLSEYVNQCIMEAIRPDKMRPGLIQLTIPLMQDMLPEGHQHDVRERVLHELKNLFEKIWDTEA